MYHYKIEGTPTTWDAGLLDREAQLAVHICYILIKCNGTIQIKNALATVCNPE